MPDEQPKDEKPFRACIPLEERPRNDVDRHHRYIEDIQYCCEHDFRFLEPPDLRESEVKDVFIAFQADWRSPTEPEEVKLQCMHCSLQKVWDSLETCSRCLYEGGFEKSDFLHGRALYFGEGYSYYRVRLYKCPKCGFQMVSDEWDQ